MMKNSRLMQCIRVGFTMMWLTISDIFMVDTHCHTATLPVYCVDCKYFHKKIWSLTEYSTFDHVCGIKKEKRLSRIKLFSFISCKSYFIRSHFFCLKSYRVKHAGLVVHRTCMTYRRGFAKHKDNR